MRHLGDITKIDGHNVPLVDVVCGGSPCQDLSVAGKRAGLAGQRSGLFIDQIRVIKEMRDESRKRLCGGGANVDLRLLQPRFMVWENVPGAFSSNGGEDFRAVLEETARVVCESAVIPKPPRGGADGLQAEPSWEMGGLLLGVYTMHSFGESPSEERESLLSQILEDNPPRKYSLSAKACQGILRRAKNRGKELPPELEAALIAQSVSKETESTERTPQDAMVGDGVGGGSYTLNTIDRPAVVSFQERAGCEGGAKESLFRMSEQEPCPHSTTNLCMTVDEKMGNTYIGNEVGNTLGARDYKQPQAVVYGLDRASFNQGENALYDFSVEEQLAQTVIAKGPGGY